MRKSSSWYAVGVLALAYTFSYIDRSILSLMVGPIRTDLGISDTQFSLLHGLAFALFYTLLGVPIARLADRTNRRNLIAVGVAFWSLMTAACGLARSFGGLFLARIGVGVGEATLSPAAYSMIADMFSREKLGRAIGIYSSGVYLGIGFSFLLGGLLIEALSGLGEIELPLIGTLKPWQMTFMVVGLPGLLVALLVMTLTEPVRARTHAESGFSVSQVVDYFQSHRSTYLLHFAGFSMITLMYNGLLAWAAELFIRIHEMARGDIGPLLGVMTLVFGSAGIICGGLLSDYLARKGYRDAPLRAAIAGACLLVPLGVIAPLVENTTWVLVLFCPLLFAGSFPFGPAATALQLVSPPAMRAQISAVYLFCVNLTGIGLGATATALVTDYVFRDDMQLHVSMSLVSAIAGGLSIVLLLLALKPYRKSIGAVESEPSMSLAGEPA